ncbi:DUF6531 domain-containing protein [Pseudomonas sp. No.21]
MHRYLPPLILLTENNEHQPLRLQGEVLDISYGHDNFSHLIKVTRASSSQAIEHSDHYDDIRIVPGSPASLKNAVPTTPSGPITTKGASSANRSRHSSDRRIFLLPTDTNNQRTKFLLWSISMLLCFPALTYAETYQWAINSAPPYFSSPEAACIRHHKLATSQDLYNSYQFVKVVKTSHPGYFYCIAKNVNPSNGNLNYEEGWIGTATRVGDSCPLAATYNSENGECERAALSKGEPPPQLTCPSTKKGNPIDISSGNKFQAEIDIEGPLEFRRSYNSMDGLWRHNYSMRLRVFESKVTIVFDDGRESTIPIINGTLEAAPLELGTLSHNNSTWKYISPQSIIYEFDANGRLSHIKRNKQKNNTRTLLGRNQNKRRQRQLTSYQRR